MATNLLNFQLYNQVNKETTVKVWRNLINVSKRTVQVTLFRESSTNFSTYLVLLRISTMFHFKVLYDYKWFHERTRSGQSCILIGYPNKQIGLSHPLEMSWFFPQGQILFVCLILNICKQAFCNAFLLLNDNKTQTCIKKNSWEPISDYATSAFCIPDT